jgi:hypothetical protein
VPDLVREQPSNDEEQDGQADEIYESYDESGTGRQRYLYMAFTALLSINLVVIFGALTFYVLLIRP